jgi:hypothetical protein
VAHCPPVAHERGWWRHKAASRRIACWQGEQQMARQGRAMKGWAHWQGAGEWSGGGGREKSGLCVWLGRCRRTRVEQWPCTWACTAEEGGAADIWGSTVGRAARWSHSLLQKEGQPDSALGQSNAQRSFTHRHARKVSSVVSVSVQAAWRGRGGRRSGEWHARQAAKGSSEGQRLLDDCVCTGGALCWLGAMQCKEGLGAAQPRGRGAKREERRVVAA